MDNLECCSLDQQRRVPLHSIAKECETYNEFLYEMQYMIGSMFTPDGADWGEANLKEMQELIEEIK